MQSFPGGSVVKNSLRNAGDTSSVPSPGRFHGPRGNKAHRPLTVGLLKWASEARVPGAASLQRRSHRNGKPAHRSERAVPARCNYRQPTQSKEYAAQPEKKKNQVLSNNYTIELRQ